MKILTKGIYYYKPIKKERYADQNLDPKKVEDYINDDLVMIWHDCDAWSRREGTNRVSLKHEGTKNEVSHYVCPHCDFTYDLDNNLALIESR